MSLVLSTLLGVLVLFGIPAAGVWFTLTPWNQQRVQRARAYRASGRKPWWLP